MLGIIRRFSIALLLTAHSVKRATKVFKSLFQLALNRARQIPAQPSSDVSNPNIYHL
ncbi:MAG: hypothetical protein K0Q74_759 [Gammaproteobacteria bacterium]|nr:hypothetical protein [Gammaproteobacteria bacterium]